MTTWFNCKRRARRFSSSTFSGLIICVLFSCTLIAIAARFSPERPAAIAYALPGNFILTNKLSATIPRSGPGTDALLQTVREHLQTFSTSGDARYLRYARATLAATDTRRTSSPSARLLQARILQAEHQFNDAAELLQSVVALEPGNSEAWLLMTDSLRRAGRTDEASGGCLNLALGGHATLANWCSVQLLQSRGDSERAYTLARQFLAESAELEVNVQRWSFEIAADAAVSAGRYDAAVLLYRQAMSIGKGSFATRLAYADVLLEIGEYDAAAKLLDEDREKISALIRIVVADRAKGDGAARADIDRIEASFVDMSPDLVADLRLRDRAMYELRYVENFKLALVYATANWEQQKGPEDRALLHEARQQALDGQDG